MVYVLLGYTRYEGHDLLGVYSTREEAERAYKDYCSECVSFDDVNIEEIEIDDVAKWRP